MTKPIVSSLSISFKKATTITEDVVKAKREHRQTLKNLVNTYLEDIDTGKAQSIRTAKELVEVIKLDLLLMGEATERNENLSPVEEARILKISQSLDESDPNVKALMEKLLLELNGVNDDADSSDDIQFEEEEYATDSNQEVKEDESDDNDST